MLRGPVWMFVEKFGREVLIDAEHPLAIAQRAMADATNDDGPASAPTTDTLSASAPVVTVSPDAPRAAKRSRKP